MIQPLHKYKSRGSLKGRLILERLVFFKKMKINRRQDTVLKGKTEGKKEREQSFRVSIPHTMHADTGTQRRKEKV